MSLDRPQTTCYLVLGLPRSGTSLVAGILQALGIFMGASFLEDDRGWYPTGSFHDAEWEQSCSIDIDFARLAELIQARDATGQDWGVKCVGLPAATGFIAEHSLSDVRAILTDRERERSEHSFYQVCGGDRMATAEMFDLLEARLQMPIGVPHLRIAFDALIDRPRESVARIASFVNRSATDRAMGLPQPQYRRF